MNVPANTVITLENNAALLTVDSYGGAITAFRLKSYDINPLSFAFSKEQMPENNKQGAPYQGHFLCLGRWGLPSEGEIKKGLPNHGEAANRLWQQTAVHTRTADMQVKAPLEGLQVKRKLVLDAQQPVFSVNEAVTNTNPLGRLYNMVQHPTLAAPFLDAHTWVDCNAAQGFDQELYKKATEQMLHWPFAKNKEQNHIDLRTPSPACNAVFSFIVAPSQQYGWITAYSPRHQLLIGYVWKRAQYPWIHMWLHWQNNAIQYRGIEFGTAGIHQPFSEIINTAVTLFGEKTVDYMDAGETVSKSYLCFLQPVNGAFAGILDIQVTDDSLIIHPNHNAPITIPLTKDVLHEF